MSTARASYSFELPNPSVIILGEAIITEFRVHVFKGCRFLVLKDISDNDKGVILLLTRYVLDFFRQCGYKIPVDSFAKKANIDEEHPLDGSYIEYWGLWLEGPRYMSYLNYFCHKKLEAFKEHTFQGNALNITTTNQQPLSADQSSVGQSYTSTNRVHSFSQQRDMTPRLTMILISMIRDSIHNYLITTGFGTLFGGITKEPKTDEEQPHGSLSGSTSSNFESSKWPIVKSKS